MSVLALKSSAQICRAPRTCAMRCPWSITLNFHFLSHLEKVLSMRDRAYLARNSDDTVPLNEIIMLTQKYCNFILSVFYSCVFMCLESNLYKYVCTVCKSKSFGLTLKPWNCAIILIAFLFQSTAHFYTCLQEEFFAYDIWDLTAGRFQLYLSLVFLRKWVAWSEHLLWTPEKIKRSHVRLDRKSPNKCKINSHWMVLPPFTMDIGQRLAGTGFLCRSMKTTCLISFSNVLVLFTYHRTQPFQFESCLQSFLFENILSKVALMTA